MRLTKQITIYRDINKVLTELVEGISSIFDKNLVGIYLFGSLSYGDFEPKRSDIDLVVVLQIPASSKELELIKELHLKVEKENKKWAERIECSYTPIYMLSEILPPKEPRPYYGAGIFYPEAPYGNEWIINQYLLYKHGIALLGPEFISLVKPVNIKDVQEAAIKDLFKEWEPKIGDSKWLANGHYQSYIILNLCRILYTIMNASTGSKKVSANWVKKQFPQWARLINTAEDWEYGKSMNMEKETTEFIKFVISKVKVTSSSLLKVRSEDNDQV